MYQRERTGWKKHIDFMLIDVIMLNLAFWLSYYLRFGSARAFAESSYRDFIIAFSMVEILVSISLDNLNRVVKRGYLVELKNVLILAFCSVAFMAFYLFVLHKGEYYSRMVAGGTAMFFVLFDYFARIFWKHIVRLIINLPVYSKTIPIFLLSDSKNIQSIMEEIKSFKDIRYEIKGIALVDYYKIEFDPNMLSFLDCEITELLSIEDSPEFICREWIDEVLIYLPDDATSPVNFIEDCKQMGITIHQVMNVEGVNRDKQFIEEFGKRTVLTTAFNYMMPYQVFLKRAFDILAGIVGVAFMTVIAVFVGPFIYAKSPGPIFFSQERVGKNGKHFKMYKFRSMILDAEKKKAELMDQNIISNGMMFKMEDDPRIIPGVGKFIRKTSLDEFPQFINVLKGDMSLIGTRPPTVDEWERYKYHHRARLSMRPGITGMWQVSGRSKITDFEEVVKLDTWYISNWRLSLDIKILLKTVVALIQRKGAK